jgi:O-antigen ligase
VLTCLTTAWLLRYRQHRQAHLSLLNLACFSFLASMLITNLAHPAGGFRFTWFGVAGCMAIAAAVRNLFQVHRGIAIVRTLYSFIGVQFAVGVGQIAAGGAISGGFFLESEGGFRRVSGLLAPSGTVAHANALGAYVSISIAILMACLACLPMMKTDRLCSSLAVLGGVALIGLTFCRAAVLTVVVVLVGAIISPQRRKLLTLVAASFAALMLSFAIRSDAWAARAAATTAGVEESGSGRMALNRQALEVFKVSPILGVGPGNYAFTIETNPKILALSVEHLPVHNLPLYLLATVGLVGSSSFALLSVAILRSATRSGVWGLTTLTAIASSWMLDHTLFSGKGLVFVACTFGASLGLRASPSHPDNAP